MKNKDNGVPDYGFSAGSGRPDYNNPAFRAYAAAQFLVHAERHRFFHSLNVKVASFLLSLPYLALLLVCLIIGGRAFNSPADSFEQSFYIEIAAGAATFALFPVIFTLARKNACLTYTLALLFALLSGFLGFLMSAVVQSFLIEASASLILLIFLDVGFNYLLSVLEDIRKSAQKERDACEQVVEEAEEAGSPVHGVALGGGTIDETIQFQMLKKHIRICKIIASDSPYHGEDSVRTIKAVNDMKIKDHQAYMRAKAYAEAYS